MSVVFVVVSIGFAPMMAGKGRGRISAEYIEFRKGVSGFKQMIRAVPIMPSKLSEEGSCSCPLACF